jgi:hypothetical protein
MFTTDALQNNHHIVSYDRSHFHYTTNLRNTGAMVLNPAETHRHDHEELWIVTDGNPINQLISEEDCCSV